MFRIGEQNVTQGRKPAQTKCSPKEARFDASAKSSLSKGFALTP
jgi:hypothetical protein